MALTTYSLLDFGAGNRLEQWGPYRLIRPDPTARGAPQRPDLWPMADARYDGEKGRGAWVQRTPLAAQWPVDFDDLQLNVRLTPYKHTGVFPEQQQNWRWARAAAGRSGRPLNILNLFAYTGGATMALAKDGHHVTHVDSSRPAVAWAKDNARLNHLAVDRVRWMLDDAPSFAARELKRGRQYDAVVLDPPAYGHGPTGTTWRGQRDLAPLFATCLALLGDQPAFVLLNGYAQHDTPASLQRLCTSALPTGGMTGRWHKDRWQIRSNELLLTAETGATLSTGSVVRCRFG